MPKSERLGCLYLTFLQRPGGLSFEEIRTLMPLAYTGEPESARRKFERDKEDLKKLGLTLKHYSPGEALPDRIGMADSHLYIPEDVPEQLDSISLSSRERESLASLLLRSIESEKDNQRKENLTSIYIKLFYNNLPGELPGRSPLLRSESQSHLSPHLNVVQESLMKSRVLDARYEPAAGGLEKRTLEGRGLIYYRGRWCLVARSRESGQIRFYYLERFKSLKLGAGTFKPDPGFNLKSMSLHPLGIEIHEERTITVEITRAFGPMFSNFLSGNEEKISRNKDEYKIQTTNERALFRWILQRPESLIRMDSEAASRMDAFLAEIEELYK